MHSYVFPGDLDKEIAAVGSQPIPYMRTEEFSKINLESERILLDLIHCHGGRTIIYTGSGTGAMSAVVENYVSTKGKALVINGGSFGRRWVSLCEYYGVPVVDFKVPFAKDIDYDELERTVEAESPEVFLCTTKPRPARYSTLRRSQGYATGTMSHWLSMSSAHSSPKSWIWTRLESTSASQAPRRV